jgi:uncharacterized protein YbjT (DUF2867 family)
MTAAVETQVGAPPIRVPTSAWYMLSILTLVAMFDLATAEPINRTVEVAGPERFRLSDLATEVLTAYEDPRRIIADPHARYFGAELTDQSLLPGRDARIGTLRFEDWLRQTLQPSQGATR